MAAVLSAADTAAGPTCRGGTAPVELIIIHTDTRGRRVVITGRVCSVGVCVCVWRGGGTWPRGRGSGIIRPTCGHHLTTEL